MATVDALELYGIRTQSPVLAMATGILNQGGAMPENFSLDASIAMAMYRILIELPRHASRRQLFLPLDSIELHGVDLEDIFAGQASDALRATGAAYAGNVVHSQPTLSPRNADLAGLPPLVVHASSDEILLPSIEAFVAAGMVEVRPSHQSLG